MNLNVKEAYNAMVDFLDKYYEKIHSDNVGSFLGCLVLLNDGMPVDIALWEDWIDSVNKMKKQYKKNEENEPINFTFTQSYEIAEDFLNEYYKRTNSAYEDFGNLIKGMTLLENGKSINPEYWEEWVASANKIKQLADKAGIMFCD
ncbi:TPA: hypothetical protein DEO28_03525 [Candidatus Dependentiae bacterium]|nr:MAG: hypothetical protein UR14_C0007G0006 [candidate division TM6 bacterium GW2011_GWE2_31_21]KKP53633.1 MAG: hypothetical protein UR43_C0004G0174 [candidate division TM6 bacterium GW2011_GWF2_33_332]HBS48128.1 hypothetical protein [Candidatus Dependentiae bacterium]HBZ73552.1 hypothetical protein [Candidatus Dependentiae bacterium]